MTDIFREVDDDYRQELLLSYWKRHYKLLIAAVVLIILGAVATAFYQNEQTRREEQQTAALAAALQAIQDKSADEGVAALNDVIGKTSRHQRIAARFALARLQAQKNDQPAAVATYQLVEQDGAATKAETGLARVASLGLQLDSADPAVLGPQLTDLAGDKSPWRYSAREMQGLLAIRQGDAATAHKIFSALAKDSGAPDGIHSRAGNLAQLYQGG